MSPTWDVFVTYAPADSELGTAVVDALRERAVRVWRAGARPASWPQLQRTLEGGLARCRALAVVLSEATLQDRQTLWTLSAVWGRVPETRFVVLGTPEALPLPAPLLATRCTTPEEAATVLVAGLTDADRFEVDGIGLRPQVRGAWASEPRPLLGREATLWELWQSLAPTVVAPGSPMPFPPVVQVCGPSGVGKTSLVEEYVARFGRRYPGGVFWLRANPSDGPDAAALLGLRLRRQLSSFAQEIGLWVERIPAEKLRARLGLAMGERGLPCLWVVDGLPTWLQDEALAVWLAPHPVARCLVTARSPWTDLSRQVIEVGGLSAEDGRRLLCGLDGSLAEVSEACSTLVDRVGGHPLSLELLGALAASAEDADRWTSLARRLDAVTPDAESLAEIIADRVPVAHRAATAAALTLATDGGATAAAALAAAVHRAAPAPLPYSVITAAWGVACPQQDGTPCEPVAVARQQLRALAARKLGRPIGSLQALSTPPLVRATLAVARPPLDDELAAALAGAILSELEAATDPAAASLLLDHAIEGAWSDAHRNHLLRSAAHQLDVGGHAACAAETLRLAVREADAAFGPDDPTSIETTESLAAMLERRGSQEEVRALREAVLDISVRVRGVEHLQTITRMELLARCLFALRDVDAWQALERRILRVRERVYGPLHPGTMEAQDRFTERLLALGEVTSARQQSQAATDARWEALGPDAPATLAATTQLAQSLASVGDLAHAHRLLETVVETRRRTLGPDDPTTLAAMSQLADVMRDLGFLAGARSLLEQVLEHRRQRLGPRHADTLLAMNNLAIMFWHLGDLPAARSLEEEVLDARYHDLGPEHPLTLTTMNNLAVTLRRQGEHARARVLLGHVLDVRRRDLGEHHADTLATMNNLAVTLWEEGELEAAGAIEEQILDARLEALGDDHPDTLSIMSDLASTLTELGDLEAARDLETHVLETRLRDLGEQAVETRASAAQLHAILRALGQADAAAALVEGFGPGIERLAPPPRGAMVRE